MDHFLIQKRFYLSKTNTKIKQPSILNENVIEKSIDVVLGIRTRGCRMVNAAGSTELWRPPNGVNSLSFSKNVALHFKLFKSRYQSEIGHGLKSLLPVDKPDSPHNASLKPGSPTSDSRVPISTFDASAISKTLGSGVGWDVLLSESSDSENEGVLPKVSFILFKILIPGKCCTCRVLVFPHVRFFDFSV